MSLRRDIPIDPPFNLRRADAGDVAVMVVEGEVDLVTAPAIERALASIEPARSVVVDLRDTRFMDSTGLRVLLDATHARGGRVHIACVPGGPVARLFEVAQGASHLLNVFATRDEAVAAL